MARDVFDTLGKEFFESSKKEVQVDFPPLNLDREEIIREYQAKQAQTARQQHIDSLFEKFNSEVEWDSEDEKAAFEKKANDLLYGAKDEQIDALFGYACSEWKKDHLVDTVLDNQKGHDGGNGKPTDN